MEEQRRELPHQRFTLKRKDKRVTVNYSAGDYRILSYMAYKEDRTISEMAHELFVMGLECKQHNHKCRLAELERKGKKQHFRRLQG
jgi:hypothetical protein